MKLNEPTATERRAHAARVNRAVHLMIHYMSQVYQKAGLQWDTDNDAEIRELVELMMEAK